jgi:hypothetical protein
MNNKDQFTNYVIKNVDENQATHTITARGNVQNILGLYEDIELQPDEERVLSRYNSMCI